MKTLSFRLLGLVVTLAIGGLTLAQTGGDSTMLSKISRYRQWAKVNADPVRVEIPLKADPASVAS